jgi:hypothetical protein
MKIEQTTQVQYDDVDTDFRMFFMLFMVAIIKV